MQYLAQSAYYLWVWGIHDQPMPIEIIVETRSFHSLKPMCPCPWSSTRNHQDPNTYPLHCPSAGNTKLILVSILRGGGDAEAGDRPGAWNLCSDRMNSRPNLGFRCLSIVAYRYRSPLVTTMDANSQPRKCQACATFKSPLGTAIKVANLARVISSMTPATAICFCILLTLHQ